MASSEAVWTDHFVKMTSGEDMRNKQGQYVLKRNPLPPPKEQHSSVPVITPVESQVLQAKEEIKEEQVDYNDRSSGVKYKTSPESRNPPSKRHKSVLIAPPTDALHDL